MIFLTTGSASGLCRYFYESLGGYCLTREAPLKKLLFQKPVDVVIHCAFNMQRDITCRDLYRYLEDTILLTLELTDILCKKFIYISTIDVYPKNGNIHSEDELISVFDHNNLYSLTKLYSESIIREHFKNYLIIRMGMPLGKYTRKNNLLKIILDDNPVITLTRDSAFNCVLYSDILNFILEAVKKDLHGTYNAVSNDSISLYELAEKTRKKIRFGDYFYKCDNISNTKIVSACDHFNKSSHDTIDMYIKEFV